MDHQATGKTTTYLNTVEKLFDSGIGPHELAYLAFTKKAATEADRAVISLIMNKIHYLYTFRTIHSLCYFWQGLSKSDI